MAGRQVAGTAGWRVGGWKAAGGQVVGAVVGWSWLEVAARQGVAGRQGWLEVRWLEVSAGCWRAVRWLEGRGWKAAGPKADGG